MAAICHAPWLFAQAMARGRRLTSYDPGSLNRGQAHALRTKLRNADRQIEVDRACPAVAQLQAFLEQVAGFVRSGILSA